LSPHRAIGKNPKRPKTKSQSDCELSRSVKGTIEKGPGAGGEFFGKNFLGLKGKNKGNLENVSF